MSKKQNKLYKKLGEKIREYRLIRGLNQRQLAKKLKVTWETVSRWENGRVSPIKRLQDIANILDIPVNYLLQEQFSDNTEAFFKEKPAGLPYLGDLPNTPKELAVKFKKTLFTLDLKAIAPHHSYAIKINTSRIKNLTSIPVDNNTIILITPHLQTKSKYYLYFDDVKKQFVITDKKLRGKTYNPIANILAIILQ